METANLVTYSDLWQVLGILAGIWFAYFSLVISLLVGWYIRDTNRRDKDVDRRFVELESNVDRRFREMEATMDRRFGELEATMDRRFGEMEANTDRRFREMEANTDRRFREMEEANERRHQELLKAIGALYRHVHDDDGKAIIPLLDIEPVAPAPADD